MIKLKRYALLLAGLTLISLAGCGKQEPPLTITDNPSSVGTSADVTSAAESSEDIPASPSAPAESENPTDSIPETRLQAEENRTPGRAVRHGICRRTKTACTGRRKNKSCLTCTAAGRTGTAKTDFRADTAASGGTAPKRAAAGERTARRTRCSRF